MNLEQGIADRALHLVKTQKRDPFQKAESEYRALCESFPILLRSAGLLQAAVFLKAKAGHPHGTLYAHLSDQLRQIKLLADNAELVDVISSASTVPPREYRLFTQMAGRIAHWHKRMAQAFLSTKKEGGAK